MPVYRILLIGIVISLVCSGCNSVDASQPSTTVELSTDYTPTPTIQISPEPQLNKLDEVEKYIKHEDYDSAIAILEQLLIEDRDNSYLYLLLAEVHIKNHDKELALENYKKAILLSGYDKDIYHKWWELIIEIGKESDNQILSDKDIHQLESLASYTSYIDCFPFTEILGKDDMLFFIYLYLNDYSVLAAGEYCEDEFGITLNADEADIIAKNAFGIGIQNKHEDYTLDYDSIICKNGIYRINQGDTYYLDLKTTGYAYLGNDLFYVVLSGDDSNLPGPETDMKGVQSDYMRLIFKKVDHAFGFTIVSKLKEGDSTLMEPHWELPTLYILN